MLSILPRDVVACICLHLDFKEIRNLSLTCKALRDAIDNNVFYHLQYNKLYKLGWSSIYDPSVNSNNTNNTSNNNNSNNTSLWKIFVKKMVPPNFESMKKCEQIMYTVKGKMFNEYLDLYPVTVIEIYICILNIFIDSHDELCRINHPDKINVLKNAYYAISQIYHMIDLEYNGGDYMSKLVGQLNYAKFCTLKLCKSKVIYIDKSFGMNYIFNHGIYDSSDANVKVMFLTLYDKSLAKVIMKTLMSKYGKLCMHRLHMTDFILRKR
jgi:hypothetical protein